MSTATPDTAKAPDWNERRTSRSMDKKFFFNSYRETSMFLEQLAALSEERGYYPDLSFGPKHVSVSLHLPEGEAEREFRATWPQSVDDLAEAITPQAGMEGSVIDAVPQREFAL